ncbi:MAG: response regulator [Thiobacillaceae bacterium]|nr:response regulator [Thiobacillaceae bacterium]MDW8322848.1 response regulator [Burkholderiales bacterium]
MQGHTAGGFHGPILGSIVLVEDDPSDLDLMLRALGRCSSPPAVTVARDGEAVLDLMRTWLNGAPRPSVVLLDLQLPRRGGLEVLRDLRIHYAASTLPVVVWTSSGAADDIAAAYAGGANAYVVKPLRFEELVATACHIQHFWCQCNTTLD